VAAEAADAGITTKRTSNATSARIRRMWTSGGKGIAVIVSRPEFAGYLAGSLPRSMASDVELARSWPNPETIEVRAVRQP